MDLLDIASFTLVFVAFVAFAGKRLMTYMHVLQQEDYFNTRLFGWIMKNGAFDKRISIALIVLGIASIVIPTTSYAELLPSFALNFLIFLVFVIGTYIEKDPRKNSKKKLVATTRAKRIFFPAFIAAIAFAALLLFFPNVFLWIGIVQLLPFLLIIANLCLQPFEDAIQMGYWKEAHEKVLDYNPKVIGITGSFGKTSIKHILGHILKMQAPTLITPGSVNTPMGITRVIREQLEPEHQYLVVEMGAYGPGSIKRLCDLTPPDLAIISSIGHAHYERFKTLDTVAQAKYELAEAVLNKNPDDGRVIVHERTLRFEHSRKMKADNPKNFIVAGEALSSKLAAKKSSKEPSYIEADDLQIQKIEQNPHGLKITFKYKGQSHSARVPIHGVHHGHNIALAYALAMELGISSEDIIDALASVPQIQHRLEVKPQADGTILIDDAYNSNPVGFQAALNVLAGLRPPGEGRKILITPGMVELGGAHDDAHEKIGRSAGEICDVCLVVTPERIPSFIKGFKETGSNKVLREFTSFKDAQAWYIKNKQSLDVLLIENDLPDMYERIPKM